jgi:hypothetical protein
VLAVCDPPHMAKNLRGSFANWILWFGGFPVCMSILCALRHGGDSPTRLRLRDAVGLLALAYRDRMSTDHVVAICRKSVADAVRAAGTCVVTVVPDQLRPWDRKHTIDHSLLLAPVACAADVQGRIFVCNEESIFVVVTANPARLVQLSGIGVRESKYQVSSLDESGDGKHISKIKHRRLSALAFLPAVGLYFNDVEDRSIGLLDTSTLAQSVHPLNVTPTTCWLGVRPVTFDYGASPVQPAERAAPLSVNAMGHHVVIVWQHSNMLWQYRPARRGAELQLVSVRDSGCDRPLHCALDAASDVLYVTDAGGADRAPAVRALSPWAGAGARTVAVVFSAADHAPLNITTVALAGEGGVVTVRPVWSDGKQHVVMAGGTDDAPAARVLVGRAGVAGTTFGAGDTALLNGPRGIVAVGRALFVCCVGEHSLKLWTDTAGTAGFLDQLRRFTEACGILDPLFERDSNYRRRLRDRSLPDVITELEAVFSYFDEHIAARRHDLQVKVGGKVEGEHGSVFYRTVARLAVTVRSLRGMVTLLQDADLPALVARIRIKALGTDVVEHLFSLARSQRDRHPDLLSYARKTGAFQVEYMKSVCSDLDFNFTTTRRALYQPAERTSIGYDTLTAGLAHRSEQQQLSPQQQLTVEEKQALRIISELIRPEPTQTPRDKTRGQTGVPPLPLCVVDPHGDAPAAPAPLSLTAPRLASAAAAGGKDGGEDEKQDGRPAHLGPAAAAGRRKAVAVSRPDFVDERDFEDDDGEELRQVLRQSLRTAAPKPMHSSSSSSSAMDLD